MTDTSPAAVLQFRCSACNGPLQYKPGTQSLTCPYCGTENPVPQLAEAGPPPLLDLSAALADPESALRGDRLDVALLRCGACGAEFTMAPNLRADRCPFCGSPSVQQQEAGSAPMLRPQGVIPFAMDKPAVRDLYRRWLHGLWFAPNALKREARQEDLVEGLYLPYWSFDCATRTDYDGARGDYYYTGSGKNRTRRTRWSNAHGRVQEAFSDVLVLASESLPRGLTEKLEPWSLQRLETFQPAYLSGFRAERYAVALPQGFSLAQQRMLVAIRAEVSRDIGGDTQRIDRMQTDWLQPQFRHLLLPVWVAAYRYRGRSFRFLVNGQTGEVQGERPWSALKLAVAGVLAALAIAGAMLLVVEAKNDNGIQFHSEFHFEP